MTAIYRYRPVSLTLHKIRDSTVLGLITNVRFVIRNEISFIVLQKILELFSVLFPLERIDGLIQRPGKVIS